MKHRLCLVLTLMLLTACTAQRGSTLDYVRVGRLLRRIHPPYLIDLRSGPKQLLFIGCDHNRDTTHPQFAAIARGFQRLRPQVAFNEGGQVAGSQHFPSAAAGIRALGEIGAMKYWSDAAGIPLLNGDTADRQEFALMLKRYPADQLYLYYVMERLVIPYLNGAYGQRPFPELYAEAAEQWFVAEGFPLAEQQRSLAYFHALYQRYTGHAFALVLGPDIERFDYVNGGDCRFCAIGRASKMVRDSVLLIKLDVALREHDRVMVTFGLGHALAREPALRQLVLGQRR